MPEKLLDNPASDGIMSVPLLAGGVSKEGDDLMKQPTATTYNGQVAPYHQQIPDYVHGMVLPDWITVLYCRLSKGDKDKEKEDDSDSIVNQKKMLGRYAIENHLPNPIFFVGDDVTGTTFKREDFQAAMSLVEEGRVKNFVTKDMSRFGRDYIRVGLFMEIFQDMDVRLVAIYDNVDSARGIDDMTPFRNVMNELYARDCSKKIRAVFRAKGLAGEHTTTNIPYGYKRDPKNPKGWVIDEEAAEIVRQIYRWCLAGMDCKKQLRFSTAKRKAKE